MRSLPGYLLALLCTCCTSSSSRAQQPEDQLFSRYSVALRFQGKPVRPVLDSADARMFRTRIRQGVAAGVVFADHYSVPVWGCGSGCLQFAIVDARTGKVYIFPFTVSADREEGERLAYHRNSRAMHIISSLNERNSADRWYVWDGSKLKLISQKPAKLAPDFDPDK